VILVDASLLLYAHDAADRRHESTRDWLERLLATESDVRFGLATILAFVRIATDPRVYEHPRSAVEAIGIVDALLARPNVSIANPGDRHWRTLADLAETRKARGPLLMMRIWRLWRSSTARRWQPLIGTSRGSRVSGRSTRSQGDQVEALAIVRPGRLALRGLRRQRRRVLQRALDPARAVGRPDE
jgi:predicted nucleic acid-binding protein